MDGYWGPADAQCRRHRHGELALLVDGGRQVCERVRSGDDALPDLAALERIPMDIEADYLLREFPLAVERALDGIARVSQIVSAPKDFGRPDQRDRVCVEIGDNGGGIAADDRPRIFEPFFTTKPLGKGTGQGLAISRSIVFDKHGSSISFDSEVGRSTRFLIKLPLEAPSSRSATSESAGIADGARS